MNSYEYFLLSEATFKRNLKREEEMIKKLELEKALKEKNISINKNIRYSV
jgi:hypothetical protein